MQELCAPISGFLYSELEIRIFLPNLAEGVDSNDAVKNPRDVMSHNLYSYQTVSVMDSR